jgi:ubiquinol-cytochrome c reductase iron-sulfur subunit
VSAHPERSAAAGFVGTVAACAVFVVAYALDAGEQVLGVLLALACAGLAFGLAIWGKHLLPAGTYVEEKEPLTPPASTQSAFDATLLRGAPQTPVLVRRTFGLALLGFGAALVVPLRGLLFQPVSPRRKLSTTAWKQGTTLRRFEGEPVRVDDLDVGTALTVFPEPKGPDDAAAVLLRLDPAAAPQGAVDGIVAFSRLCTHAGCPVGLYEQQSTQLLCPCHQSVFDVRAAAKPIFGPASRPLPRLPLYADEQGVLHAAGDFDGQVGPTYWRRER